MRQFYTNGAPATAQLAAHALATYPAPMPAAPLPSLALDVLREDHGLL